MDIINEIKKAVEVNPMGHLPLLYRVLLANQIKNKDTLLKIYFECSKKVYPIWQEEFPDNISVYDLLKKADDYLYYIKGAQKDIIQMADKYKNYIEGINSVAGAAGLSALYLCYKIGTDIAFEKDYNGIDDDDYLEYEDRLPDFYASVAYSGGNPFAFEGDVEKRREFWNWYISSIVETLIDNPNKPIIPLKEKKIIPAKTEQLKRTQSYNDEKNKKLIQELIHMTVDFLKEKNISYDVFKIEASCISLNYDYDIYISKKQQENMVDLSYSDILKFIPTKPLIYLKENMYEQAPKEGAWFNCSLIVDNNSYKLDLNYDYKDNLFDPDVDEAVLVNEFENFPRAIEYTPDWMKSILGNKAKYLE